ncbi:MAG: hypothetical protein HRU20_29435 [Pseudomonadales bacterium]|nr:hypothetical protein [Pseudomonadales bacterium]
MDLTTDLEVEIENLFQSFSLLQTHIDQFHLQARADDKLPIYLPNFQSCIKPEKQRLAAINALCQLRFDDKSDQLPETGLLCISEETAKTARLVNQEKHRFQQQIKTIRNHCLDHPTAKNHGKVAVLLEQLLAQGGLRNPSLQTALKTLNIQRLNLQRCYCQLRILPNALESLSWTWAKSHSEIQKLTHTQAMQLCQQLPDEHAAKQAALATLSMLAKNAPLAFKRKKQKQLRANICWRENQQIKRKAVTVSGVLLTTDTQLPRFRWPDENEHSRLSRMDQKIETAAIIPALHLYRYKDLPNK